MHELQTLAPGWAKMSPKFTQKSLNAPHDRTGKLDCVIPLYVLHRTKAYSQFTLGVSSNGRVYKYFLRFYQLNMVLPSCCRFNFETEIRSVGACTCRPM